MNNKVSINAIYPTNECPTFYLCNDGMYSTKNGRNACFRHGGLNKNLSVTPPKNKLNWNAKAWEKRNLPPFAKGDSWKLGKKSIEQNDFFEIKDFTNTKTGEKLKIVIVKKRVDSTAFDILRKRAKKLNGYWSGFAKGFLFQNIFDAENFVNAPFEDTEETTYVEEKKPAKKEKKAAQVKKVGKISFKMPEGEELKEQLKMGKDALDIINSVGYKEQAPFYKNPSFLYPILVYLKYNADRTENKYSRGRGDFYQLDYDGIKVIAPIWFKEMYPDAQNVRISRKDYSSLILSATFPASYKGKEWEIEKHGRELLEMFNYDDSDSMTDYFHSRFYVRANISFKDANQTQKNKNAPKYFWTYSDRNKRWYLSEFYFGKDKNKPSFSQRIGLKRKKTESYQDVFDRAKLKYSAYGINFDNADLRGGYGTTNIYKDFLSNGDITEDMAMKFYDGYSISGIENSISNFVFYNSDVYGYAILAFIAFKALSK